MLCMIECSFVEQTLILLQENDTGLQRHSMSGIITDAVGSTRIRCLTWQTCFRSDSVSPKRGPSLHALQRDEAITFPPKAEQVLLQTRRVRKPFPGGLFAMDGTLCRCTEKGRRNDFFCRKGYPCINVQLDSRNRAVTFETPWNRLNARSMLRSSTSWHLGMRRQ